MRPPLHLSAIPPPPLPPTKEPLLGWLFHASVWLMVLLVVGGILLAVGMVAGRFDPKALARAMHGMGYRAIGQGWLAHDNNIAPSKPSEAFADVYDFAAMLARELYGSPPPYGGDEDNPAALKHWFYAYDPAWLLSKQHPRAILMRTSPDGPVTLAPNFRGSPVAWAVAIFPPDIRVSRLPPETPLVWTRGLRPDGTWREDSPFAGEGGVMSFAGGNATQSQGPLGSSPYASQLVKWGTKTPTTNILEALPPGTRISEYVPPPEVAACARWLPWKRRLLVTLSGALLFAACLAGTRSSARGWKRWLAKVAGAACALWFWCEWFG